MANRITIAELLAVKFNRTRLEQIRHSEENHTTSALNRYKRMTTSAPPIIVDHDGTVLDGLHRLAVAMDAGQTDIAAQRHTHT